MPCGGSCIEWTAISRRHSLVGAHTSFDPVQFPWIGALAAACSRERCSRPRVRKGREVRPPGVRAGPRSASGRGPAVRGRPGLGLLGSGRLGGCLRHPERRILLPRLRGHVALGPLYKGRVSGAQHDFVASSLVMFLHWRRDMRLLPSDREWLRPKKVVQYRSCSSSRPPWEPTDCSSPVSSSGSP